jgi:excisionase family DNA binding protein
MQVNITAEERILSRQEAAKILKISLATLWRRTKEGDVKGVKFGHRVLYRYSDLMSIGQPQAITTEPQPEKAAA